MQNEWFLAHRLDGPSQLRLVSRGVDMGIPMVLKNPEISIETDINARRLNHLDGIWFEPDAASIDFGLDVPVREQHGGTLPREAAP
jgi:hypothetical protein